MFIIEEPYVSDLMLKTLEKNKFEVLDNEFVRNYTNKYDLNLIDEKTALKKYSGSKNGLKVYSNSENSIDWVIKNFPDSNISDAIKIFKNKYEFRKLISSIYPDFFFCEYSLEELSNIDITKIKKPFIIKPSVGFLSLGVYKVETDSDWKKVLKNLQQEAKSYSKIFPSNVVNSSGYIIEEIIKGKEYAVDAYYTQQGIPVVLNIFQHPFADSDDVSDRLYLSSKNIIQNTMPKVKILLEKLGKLIDLKNFPMHIEIIEKENGEIVPVEINPMRFAGWCTTDLACFAYGINMYEYFHDQSEPDWEKIFSRKGNEYYYFAMAETPKDMKKDGSCSFDYEKLKKCFSNILEFRKIDYLKKPLFAILFGQTQDNKEIDKILKLKTCDFVKTHGV